ncbi:MAG TPA: extracellular solute-binding protein [Candidatus Limnocylindrales bacterium]|nr:extracellular solute-binding protein [Candidatus Limnocylindrales bacterium]
MKHPIRLAGLLAGLAIVAGACGPGGTGSSAPTTAPGTGGAPSTTAPSSDAPAALSGKITLWHSYGSSGGGAESAEVKALNQVIAAITTANPDLEIEAINVPFADIFKNFETESGTGGGPDMFIAPNDNLGSEVRGGYLLDLTGKIDGVIADTSDVAANGSMVDGKVYMVPESLKAVAMYYDSAKITTPPTTTDELKALVDGGGKVGVITGNYFGWGFYSAFGGKIFDDAGKCAATANTGIADAITYVRSLNEAGATVDSDYAKINDPFIAGDLDLILNGNWALGDYRNARSTLAVAPFPSGPAGAGRSMTGVDGWYINSAISEEQQALAIAVASELVSAESQQIMVDTAGHVPANKNVTSTDALVKSFTDAIYAGDPRPQTAEFGNYWTPFADAWSKSIPDDESAGGDVTQLVADACAALDTLNSK